MPSNETRPYRRRTNGKAKLCSRLSCANAWLRPRASEDERKRALDAFMEYYNNDRPHLGIKGLTSLTRLAAVSTTLLETTQGQAISHWWDASVSVPG